MRSLEPHLPRRRALLGFGVAIAAAGGALVAPLEASRVTFEWSTDEGAVWLPEPAQEIGSVASAITGQRPLPARSFEMG